MTVSSQTRVALFGTGIMGGHMARRLAGAGFPVTVWNRTHAKAAALAGDGIEAVEDARKAAANAEVAIVMLMDGASCDELLFERGVAEALPKGATVAVMSSIRAGTARAQGERLAAMGIGYVDAPVSGGEGGARDGKLSIMAGGSEAALAALAPVFAPMGRTTRIGDIGAGQVAKHVNQLIVGVTIAAVAEGMVLAQAAGVDPVKVREALSGGFAASTILAVHGERIARGDWKPGGAVSTQLKDLKDILALGEASDIDLAVTGTVARLYGDLVEAGGADLDHSALFLEILRRNGLDDPRLGALKDAGR